MRYEARKMLANNLRGLMSATPGLDTQVKIAKKAIRPDGKMVGQTTVGMMLNPEHPVSPKLDTVEAVAKAFGYEAWQLLHPSLGDSQKASILLSKLASATPKERAAVAQLLEMDAVPDYVVSRHIKPARKVKPK